MKINLFLMPRLKITGSLPPLPYKSLCRAQEMLFSLTSLAPENSQLYEREIFTVTSYVTGFYESVMAFTNTFYWSSLQKVKLFLCLFKHHSMEEQGKWGYISTDS